MWSANMVNEGNFTIFAMYTANKILSWGLEIIGHKGK